MKAALRRLCLAAAISGSICCGNSSAQDDMPRAGMTPPIPITHSRGGRALAGPGPTPSAEKVPTPFSDDAKPANSYYLTLDDAKTRVLANSPVMDLVSLQIAQKCHTLEAARKDYLPKLLTSFTYFHFDRDLGSVVKTPGIFNPATAISVPIINQDAPMFMATAIQPITPLLKVQQAVNIGSIDVATAQAQAVDARRELTKGVEQLYFGILATQRIRATLEQAVAGSRQLVRASNVPENQMALLETQQNLLTADNQLVQLTEQMNSLIELPSCTDLKLDEPPVPQCPFSCVDQAVAAATSTSPKIREAQLDVQKAEAALRLANADYYPNVLAYGIYSNQQSTPVIQEQYTGVGVSATYTLEWGKKNDNTRAAMATVCLARKNLQKETQDLELAAAKAYHDAESKEQAYAYAKQIAKLSQEVKAPASDPLTLKAVVKAQLEAAIAEVKAELDYRTAAVELCSITGHDG